MQLLYQLSLSLTILLLRYSSTYGKRSTPDNLRDKHLLVATVDLNPYMYLFYDKNKTIIGADGVIHEMLLWMTKRYGFTFEYVEPPDGYFGAIVNGTWNGMVGMTVRKEVDLIAAQLTTTYARSLVIDFTTSFTVDPMSAVIPAPQPDSYMAAIVKPFQIDVWAYIIASLFATAIVSWILMLLFKRLMPCSFDRSDDSSLRFWTNFFYAFEVIVTQAGQTMPAPGPLGHATRIMAATWCLTCVVFVYLYSGCLTSFITIPKLAPLIESLEDLANTTALQLTILRNSVFETIIMEASIGPYKMLGDFLRNNPQNRLPKQYIEPEPFLKKALTGKFAMVDQKSLLDIVLEMAYKESGKCTVTLMKQQVVTSLDSLALQKHSPYLAQVDRGIENIAAFGLINYWENRFLTHPRCAKIHAEGLKTPRLTLSNLLGPFLLLIVGMGISFLAFIVELWVFKSRKGKQLGSKIEICKFRTYR